MKKNEKNTSPACVRQCQAQNLEQALAENKRLLARLRTRERLYREIFNATTEAITVQDSRTGRFLEVNDSMVRMYGYSSRKELMKCSIGDLSANTTPFSEEEARQLDELAVNGKPQVFDWVAKKKNGELFNVEVSLTCSPIRGKNRVLAAVRDITERKLAQDALKQANEHLEEMVNERTDQLKKMTARLIRAEEAERERIGSILHDELQQILVGLRFTIHARGIPRTSDQKSEEMIAIVDEAIEVTRTLSTDLFPPVLIIESLRDGIIWLLDDVRQRFGLDVRFGDLPCSEPRSKAVRLFAFRALQELCLNIVKHSRSKSASLTLESSTHWIRMEISDAGVGFDPSGTPTPGVGLFRIRETASHLGGTLQVTSSPGNGTRVILTLPRK